jgi:hypothetical protein
MVEKVEAHIADPELPEDRGKISAVHEDTAGT